MEVREYTPNHRVSKKTVITIAAIGVAGPLKPMEDEGWGKCPLLEELYFESVIKEEITTYLEYEGFPGQDRYPVRIETNFYAYPGHRLIRSELSLYEYDFIYEFGSRHPTGVVARRSTHYVNNVLVKEVTYDHKKDPMLGDIPDGTTEQGYDPELPGDKIGEPERFPGAPHPGPQ